MSFWNSEVLGLIRYSNPWTEMGLQERSKDFKSLALGFEAKTRHSLAVMKVELRVKSIIGVY